MTAYDGSDSQEATDPTRPDGRARPLRRRDLLRLTSAAAVAALLSRSRAMAGSLDGLGTRAVAPAAPAPASVLPPAARPAAPACVVRPDLTEGPYFVDEKLLRSDIRSDPGTGVLRAGAPLVLTFNVLRVAGAGCEPLPGAVVDIWQCDAGGIYSDAQDPGFNTRGQKFLRGYQVTDANGVARFTTIYPGWYQGRTVHIHFKIRLDAGGARHLEFTSQLFFDDAFTDGVYQRAPYNTHGARGTRNGNDGIFREGGDQLTLTVVPQGEGYEAIFDIALEDVPALPTATAGSPTATAVSTETATAEPPSPTATPPASPVPEPTATPAPAPMYLPWAGRERR